MKIMKILVLIATLLIASNVFSHVRKESISIQQRHARPAADQSGQQLYIKYCLTCHQADGAGVRGMFPPLAENEKITGSSKDLITIVLFGLEGPIEVNGKEYNQVMPAQDYLEDKQISDILTFIRTSWGNKASPVKPEEVEKIRKEGKPAEK